MRTRIKICGLTRAEDVRAAVEAGADAVGFVFAPSSRQVTLDDAARLAAAVPPPVARVGVFVDASFEEVESAVRVVGLTAVQLCGSETPEFCSGISVPVIKASRVGTAFAWTALEPYRGQAAAQLLDTYVSGKMGGTSKTFAWNDIGESPGWASLFVAGGLTPSNVAEAVRAMRPFAVDVSSGVESAPGLKDPSLIAAFCAAVRAVDQEVYR
ncbi:MAG: phosphoribosylanthranilate isomerase [Actinobacteria bacterium HGW-Actinobacteria-7]|jgi:phosphoribosylanthranilate isomerase|nr:MAG: phosphoribosylanthranilate isomerase [Actinobacteria bacterium HGW-Actinobacteria-7]